MLDWTILSKKPPEEEMRYLLLALLVPAFAQDSDDSDAKTDRCEEEYASIIQCARTIDPDSRALKLEIQGRISCKFAKGTYENCACVDLPQDERNLWWDARSHSHLVRDGSIKAIIGDIEEKHQIPNCWLDY